ncbi:MAG: hypothetical protein ABIT38_19815 [Gemmatimonadaceae bacterium]
MSNVWHAAHWTPKSAAPHSAQNFPPDCVPQVGQAIVCGWDGDGNGEFMFETYGTGDDGWETARKIKPGIISFAADSR